MNLDILRLTWKRLWVIVVSWFVVVVLHNVVSALLGTEEALFFILAVFVNHVYFLFILIYSAWVWVRGRN